MDAETMNRLARELIERATNERLSRLIEEAGRALDDLDAKVDTWSRQLEQKEQSAEAAAEARRVMEATEAELVLEASADGRIDGKNAEARKLQVTQLLDQEGRNGRPYGQAVRAYRDAQVRLDQGNLDLSIAEAELSAVKTRCRLIEAQLSALSHA